MTIKQIALPDVTGLASAGVTVFFMEAVTFTDDGKHLVVKATFVEDGTGGAQRFGYYLYDIANETYVMNFNTQLLTESRLTTSNIEALYFTGNLDSYTVVAEVKAADNPNSVLVALQNGEIRSSDILLDALGDDYSVNVESFALAEDGRHLAIQTSDPSLASVLNPDTNDSSDIYLLDLETQAILRISEVGGAEVVSDTDLQDIAIVGERLQIGFTTDEAYVSPTRTDQNTTDLSGPVGTRTDAYVWSSALDSSGTLTDSGSFILISELPNNTASGFVDTDSGIVLTQDKVLFSSASEFIDVGDNNNAVDSFSYVDGTVDTLTFAGTRFDADTKIIDASISGRYVIVLTSASQVSGSTGAQQLVFIDTLTGISRVVSQNSAGSAGDIDTVKGVIAQSGSYVAFSSLASNLTNEVANTFQGSLFIREYTDINTLPEGKVILDSLPLIGEDLILDFSNIIDDDGLPDEFEVTWNVNGTVVSTTNNVLPSTIINAESVIAAEVSYIDGAGNTETLLVDEFSLFDRPTRSDGSLEYSTKYIVFSSNGESVFDFDLGLSGINYKGQSSLFSGSSEVESIKISTGQILDITNLKGSQDKVFLPGELSDYLTHSSINSATSEMTLISTADFSYTELKFIATSTAADMLVFSDGQVSSTDFKKYLLNDKSDLSELSLDTTFTSDNFSTPINNTKVKAIAIDPNGETFSSFTPATTLQVSGSGGVDKVYIREGTTVDSTNLKSSVDEIYLQGSWADYSKSIDNSGNLLLSRTVSISGTDYVEAVSVASGSTIATNDLLIFADGSIRNKSAVLAVKSEEGGAFSTLDGFDGTVVTPLLESIIDTDFIFPQESGKQIDQTLITTLDVLSESQQSQDNSEINTTSVLVDASVIETDKEQSYVVNTEEFGTNIEIMF
ncbi:hypothetical protein [Opacimonas viscosa]|uniref:Uncharacterized protein n=1 Tax=Opacimonas viscosa TaxID=2961944 RepID=A0AA41X550_9ALTE|nr:hypothetical protein [Opacimonas viscosa]MCP3429681.1 hypothetical protein [Opacimonas viscosa]